MDIDKDVLRCRHREKESSANSACHPEPLGIGLVAGAEYKPRLDRRHMSRSWMR